jgi:hypothetical protein
MDLIFRAIFGDSDSASVASSIDQVASAISPSDTAAAHMAETLAAERISKGTTKTYQGKVKVLTAYLRASTEFRSLLDENLLLKIPIENNAVSIRALAHFFGKQALWNDPTIFRPEGSPPPPSLRSRPISSSALRLYKSALVWLHEEKNFRLDRGLDLGLEKLLQGYSKKIAKMKLESIIPAVEGKQPLSHAAFAMIAKKFMTGKPHHREEEKEQDRSKRQTTNTWSNLLFGWLFLVLQWNLMGRSNTVAKVLFSHLSWQEDSLLVFIPKHKGDQEGKSINKPKHVYANPFCPEICPIFALAVYVFSNSWKLTTGANRTKNALFGGTEQEHRWANTLNKIISTSLPLRETCLEPMLPALIFALIRIERER